ncbi:MAG: tetratricopeptide repeat protein [Verrucomicrobiota bacterium]
MVTITTNPTFHPGRFLPRSTTDILLLALTILFFIPLPVLGQQAKELLDQGFESFDGNRYQEAIEQLDAFLKNFPDHSQTPQARYLIGMSHYNLGNYQQAVPFLTEQTGEDKAFAPEIRQSAVFHLGASHYFSGNYSSAITAFREAGKKLPPLKFEEAGSKAIKAEQDAQQAARADYENIRSFALFYLGRTLMEYGSQLNEEEKSEEAKQLWLEGIEHINQMVNDFPETALLSDALMTRGTLQVYVGQFNEAEADLQRLKSSPEGAEMAAEADYMLGYVYTQQALQLLADFKPDEAKAATEKGREIYRKLSQDSNLIVANEAAFQLANLDFTDKNYKAAINAYRQLKSKDQLIQSQNQRLAELRRQVPGANPRKLTQIQRAIQREEQKLATVKANPELSNEAWIKIGESYMQMRDYNKARVVFRHATQFAEPDQKKRLQVQVIISHAAQGNADKADKLFAEFRQQNPSDPLAQNVKYMLGSALMQQERWDEAIQAFEESLRDFPDSQFSVQIPKDIARIKVQQGKPEEAIQTFRDFIKNGETGKIKVAPSVIEDTRRLLGVTLFQQKEYDESVQLLKDLAANASTPSIKEESHIQVATILGQLGKNEEAVAMYKSFAETYPESTSAGRALIQAGLIEEKEKKLDASRATFQDVTERFADTEIAKFAYDKIWKSYRNGDQEKLIAAQDTLIEKFPDSDQTLAALFDRAKLYDKAKEYDKALTTFMDVVERQRNTSAPSDAKARAAALSLVTAAPIKQKQATSLGSYEDLDEAGKQQWVELIQGSGNLFLQAVTSFPGTQAAAVALTKWVEVMQNLIGVDAVKPSAVINQMSQLAGEMPTEQSKLQILIAQAGLQNKLGKTQIALNLYNQAFSQVADTKIIRWQDLSSYGELLLEAEKWQKALEIFRQLDANTVEKNQRAKADALYGQGAALQGLGQSAEAQKLFDRLPAWSPRILDAKYGSALALFEAGKLQEAIDTVKEVISSTRSSNESKGKAMILMARSLETMGDTGQSTPETKTEDGDMDPYDLACNYLLKVDVLFADGLPLFSSEALYHAVRIRKKQQKNQEAQEILDRLLTEYGTTKWGQKARQDY